MTRWTARGEPACRIRSSKRPFARRRTAAGLAAAAAAATAAIGSLAAAGGADAAFGGAVAVAGQAVAGQPVAGARSGRTVLASGLNSDGELGDGTTTSSDTPVKVRLPAGTKVTGVRVTDFGLAVTTSGKLLSWGYNVAGSLGNGTTTGSLLPVKVRLPGRTMVRAARAGNGFAVALTTRGKVLAWGFNVDGALGDGSTTNSDVPVRVRLPKGTRVTTLAAGKYFSMALTSGGKVFGWGDNGDGKLGNGTETDSSTPVPFMLPPGKVAIAIGAGSVAHASLVVVRPGPGAALAIPALTIAAGTTAAVGRQPDTAAASTTRL
jgi:Regulator of chromosome condensation (RCC1) repeat